MVNKYQFLRAARIALEGCVRLSKRYAALARTMAGEEENAIQKKGTVRDSRGVRTCAGKPAEGLPGGAAERQIYPSLYLYGRRKWKRSFPSAA